MDKSTNRLQSALLTILRSGLWEREIDDLSVFPLSAEEWEQLFRMSKQQTVIGIVYQGLQYLPQEVSPPLSLLIRWTAVIDAIERRNREMNKALFDLSSLFRSHGIEAILQKGQGVAQLYEKPLLRECGDIDLCFKSRSDMDAAADCIRSQKIGIEKMPDGSSLYMWQGVEVEHHPRLLDLHNPFLRGYADRLEHTYGYDAVTLTSDEDVQATVASPFLNLLLLNLHILKHALGWGIGLRQLCDMARAYFVLGDKVDMKEMEKCSRKLGLERWNALLNAVLIQHLGLPASCLPYSAIAQDAQPLIDIVWRGGNFGFQLEERTTPAQSVLKRKLRTANSFLKKLPFVIRYAPKEAFWIVAGLLKGQM